MRGAIFSIALMVAVTEWSVGYAIELGEPVFASKLTWAKLEYFGIVVVPVAWFLYASWFTGHGLERSNRYWSSLLIIPICTLILVWSNELHGLIWSEIRLVEINRTSMFDFSYGPGFWIHTLYSYALVVTGSLLLVRYYFRSQGLYRQQARVILIAALVPWLSNAIYIFGFNPFPGLDLTPFGFTITGLLFAWGLLRLQLLDIIPLARDAVLENMQEAVMVLDARNRIVDYNPAAQAVVKRNLAGSIGLPMEQVFTDYPDFTNRYATVRTANDVLVGGDGNAPTYFNLHVSPLYNRRGDFIGRLFVLGDITEQHLAKIALEQSHDALEHRVQQRTLELENTNENLRIEIAERKAFEKALRHRVEMESLVAAISTQFINLSMDEIDQEINAALLSIGTFSGVDRSYIFRISEDAVTMDNTYEWCAEGISPQIGNLQRIPCAQIPWWMEQLNHLDDICIPRVADLPVEASAEREILDAQDIQSLVVVPLVRRKSLFGFLGFDSVRQEKVWSEEDIKLLRLIGEIFVSAFDREQAVEALRTSEAELRAVFAAMNDSVVICDRNGVYLEIAPTNPTSLYKPAEGLIGKTLFEVMPRETARLILEQIQHALDSQRTVSIDYSLRFNGQQIWFAGSISPIAGDRAILVARDITDRKASEERLLYNTQHDTLTGLPNRRFLVERLERALERKKRRPALLVGVLFLDLDNFKVINDSLGHSSGDKFLTEVGNRLKACVRGSDTVARLGGDEFAFLLDDIQDIQEAIRVAERVQNDLSLPVEFDGHRFFTSASIGIALAGANHQHPDEVLRDADAAMYRAKSKGLGRYEIYDTEMHLHNLALLNLRTDLHRAMEQNELQLFYQPVVDLRSGEVISVEALLRWQHPERGMLLPDEFLPLAEDSRLIDPIGEWVLRTACSQVETWHRNGFDRLRVAVNTSAQQFRELQLLKLIPRILNESGLPPQYLELEVTEQIAMSDIDLTIKTLDRLSEMGVQISIDDFGKGYSSLNYLKIIPTNTLKIDRSFIWDVLENHHGASIASAIISMAHALNLNVTAEGVETEQQLDFLVSQNCDQIQGFLVSPAVPAETLTRLLRSGSLL
jgi:diguanylate cyclase (GGDEF)-like protein/PAS domain S-box-containing protein